MNFALKYDMKLLLCILLLSFLSRSKAQGPSSDGAIRLVRDGNTSPDYTSGVVQVWWNGQWGNICDQDNGVFGFDEADVICHQLGWSGASDYTMSQYDGYLNDPSVTSLYSLSCFNSLYVNIFQCTYSTTFSSFCDDNTDVSVTCYSTRIWDNAYDGQIRLQRGTYSNQGLVEVYCNGEWGTICDDFFFSTEATVICRQLGYNDYYLYNHLSITGNSTQKIWLDDVDCSFSTYNCIANCASCPSAEYHNCGHSEDVTIECDISSFSTDPSTDTSTCVDADDGSNTPTTFTSDSAAAIIGGIVGGIVFLIVLFAVVPICICVCIACCAGSAASRSRGPVTYTGASATTAAVVTTAVEQTAPPSYTTAGYPQQQQEAPTGYGYPMATQQGGYPPQQGGYPPQQGGYPPQQGSYPPQQVGYPPQQGGYPLQQGAYPPQQGAYPPQQGYPPQQPTGYGYPPQDQQPYVPDGGYPPQGSDLPPYPGGLPSDPPEQKLPYN